tara:strand:- start:2628 stop:2801 length:174 start_codon:yes stop_codon:yes gene_type:complete
MNPKYAKICPKCQSLDIRTHNKLTTGFIPSTYICNNCKYEGQIFPEINLKDKENVKE